MSRHYLCPNAYAASCLAPKTCKTQGCVRVVPDNAQQEKPTVTSVMNAFHTGSHLRFWYTNHRGERERRNVITLGVDYGSNEWYSEPQWFLRCWDLDRDNYRSFAFAKIEGQTIVRAGQ